MSETKDGGSAFPIPPLVIGDQMWDDRSSDGMSLRDWFAGQALAGLAALMPGDLFDDIAAEVRGGQALRHGRLCLGRPHARKAFPPPQHEDRT